MSDVGILDESSAEVNPFCCDRLPGVHDMSSFIRISTYACHKLDISRNGVCGTTSGGTHCYFSRVFVYRRDVFH